MPDGPPSARSADAVAMRLLAARDLTRRELGERLGRRGFDSGEIARVVEALAPRYIDDRRLAYNAILSRSRRMRLGRGRLDAELRRRGVSEEDLAAAWEAAQAGYDGPALLAQALEGLLRASGPPRDRRGFERMARQLARRGFPTGEILAALDPLRPAAFEAAGDREEEEGDDDELRDP